MKITRRKLLKASVPLLATPAIIRPSAAQNIQFSGKPSPTSPGATIPLSKSDARFTSNKIGSTAGFFQTGTLANQNWDESPTYPGGDSCWTWNGTGSQVFGISKCIIDCREGPRVSPAKGATFNIDQCFINVVGKTSDHADCLQAFNAPVGANGNVHVTNTCFRSYTDADALSIFGAGFIGSDGVFWADFSQGSITFDNCLFWSGYWGVEIFADNGTTTDCSFNNCYFVGPFQNDYLFLTPAAGSTGVVNITNWTNVFDSTIVDGSIVPGSAIPNPATLNNPKGKWPQG
jgi:hypothetical protein